MTRGRRPVIALGEAMQIAKKRGETRQFMHERDMICNFVIYCAGFIAHVRIKRVSRLHCPHAWIEREAADALITLRAIASEPGISRELWIFLPYGSFRFFRVTDTGLIELDRDGSVLPLPEITGPTAGVQKPVPHPRGWEGAIPQNTSIPPEQPVGVPPPAVSVGELTPGQGRGPGDPTR
jgi:hypothetical protein